MARSKPKGAARRTGTTPAPTAPLAFRLTPELVARLDAFVGRLDERTPGVRHTRADALRALLERALTEEGL